MIEEKTTSLIEEISQDKKKIIELVDKLVKKIDKLEAEAHTRTNKLRRQNPHICKSVIKYLAQGHDKNNACILTAEDYQTTPERVKIIFNAQNRYMSAINLYAKRFLCLKLKKADFSAKEISNILGISINHIYKLLRCEINLK